MKLCYIYLAFRRRQEIRLDKTFIYKGAGGGPDCAIVYLLIVVKGKLVTLHASELGNI